MIARASGRRPPGSRVAVLLTSVLLAGSAWCVDRVRADEPFPRELTEFVPYERNPVFTAAGPGTWEVKIRERGWIERPSPNGPRWRMWYTGYDGTRPGIKQVGLADSPDGLTWQRVVDQPIIASPWTEDLCLAHDGEQFVMVAEGFQDRAHWLTSRDGIAWEERGTLDVRLQSGAPIEEGPFGTPVIRRDADRWLLFYERRDAGVWLAASTDLKTWVNLQDEPVLSPGPELADRDLIALNQIFRHRGTYYGVYHGAAKAAEPGQPSIWATGLARSTDLVHWEKFGQPLRPIAENKSSGLILHDGERFRLYTLHAQVDVHFGPPCADE